MASLTIDQVSNILQVEVSTLRYWEKEFSEFLNIKCQKGQRARYTEESVEMFSQIKELLYNEQYTIKGAKRRLEMERTLTSALGMEANFNTTVFLCFQLLFKSCKKPGKKVRNWPMS